MLNSQLNSSQLNDSWLNPWTLVDTWIVEASLWPDIDVSKYVFFQMDWTQVVKKINLADFFEREDNLWIHFLDDNFRDLPNKEITSYYNPFSNWGKVINEKFPDKEVELSLKIVADSHYNLEATITDLKTRFDNWWQLQINENWHLKYLDVVLSDFKIDAEWGIWRTAEITVTFLSLNPIKKSSLQTISKLAQVWDIDVVVSILESQEDIIPEFQILIKEVTWTITSATISYNWYNIKYTWPLIAWDNLSFLWITWECQINWAESDFDWVITEIETWKQTEVWVSFEWWTPTYSLYILYNNLSK